MPYKSIEKRRAYYRMYSRAYYAKHKDEPQSIEKRRAYGRAYNATHKEVRAAYRATHKEEQVAWYQKNIEKIKRKSKEYYQKNRVAIILRTKRYHLENKEWRKKYYQGYYAKIRLEVLARVDPALKCAMCGCDDTRFLEVNHIKGGGVKERIAYRNEKHNESHNMILLIHNRKRGVEDLNLLCRACNSIDHLERVYGHTGLRVVWDKKNS
ncbi:MAG: hypothetical protein NPMRIOTA_680001 [Nitrosopumilales archaeon]|nr:MAG: hypothetical protein NPMRIOTA_680001 [Nitrosopumilales archaeon]